MSLHDPKLYDVRLLERNLRKGLISREEYDKFVATLPDLSDRVAVSRPDEHPEGGTARARPAPVAAPATPPPPAAIAGTTAGSATGPGGPAGSGAAVGDSE